MATEKTKKKDEAQIRQLVDNWAKALRAKDVDGLMANYSPDMLLFDLAPPLQYKGAEAYRKPGRSGYRHSRVRLASIGAK